MKNYIIIICTFLSHSVLCQIGKPVEYKNIKQIAFFNKLSTFERHFAKVISLPENEHEIVAVSVYFQVTNLPRFEYFKVEKDTFLFVSYDSLSKRVVEKGYIYASDESIGVDTLVFDNPTTNAKDFVSLNSTKPHKHGLWIINKKDTLQTGKYLKNRKTGIWKEEISIKEDYREQMYNNGELVYEKQLNLAKSKDLDSIKKWLLGKWNVKDNMIYNNDDFIGYSTNKKITTGYRSNMLTGFDDDSKIEILEFCPNSVIKMYNKTFDNKTWKYSFTEPHLGTWKINSDFLIEVQTADAQKVIYKPLYMKDDWLRFEKLIVN